MSLGESGAGEGGILAQVIIVGVEGVESVEVGKIMHAARDIHHQHDVGLDILDDVGWNLAIIVHPGESTLRADSKPHLV